MQDEIVLPLECPPLRQRMYDYLEHHSNEFDAILTFCHDYVGGKWMYRPHFGSMIRQEDMHLYHKTKFCSMVVSGKMATPNHAFRKDDINAILDKPNMALVTQPDTSLIRTESWSYASSLPCVEDWLWKHHSGLFGNIENIGY